MASIVKLLPKSTSPLTVKICCSISLLLWVAGCTEKTPPPVVDPEAMIVDVKGDLHREVWRTVYAQYYDPELNGVDWVKVGRETNEDILHADNMDAVYGVLSDMVAALGDPHTCVLSPREYESMQQGEYIDVGITTGRHETADDLSIVLRVAHDSPAEAAGVQPGWMLLNKHEINANKQELGVPLYYRFLDNREQLRECELTPVVLKKTENFRECELLEHGVLYLRFDFFEDGVEHWLKACIEAHSEAEAIVVDLRWNPGGYIKILNKILELFLPSYSLTGFSVTRSSQRQPERIASDFVAKHTDHPLAVLVSPYSASCSEIMASVIQHHKRGIIVGTGTTSGEVLFSPGWKLPGGGLLKIAAKNYLAPSGKPLQGHGVTPDVTTDPRSFFEFRRGIDPTLDEAVFQLFHP